MVRASISSYSACVPIHMEPSALCEAPFSSVHAGGPEALFAGKGNVIEGIFEKLKALQPEPLVDAG